MIVAAGVAGARGLQSGDLENGGRLEVAEPISVRKGMVLAPPTYGTKRVGTLSKKGKGVRMKYCTYPVHSRFLQVPVS